MTSYKYIRLIKNKNYILLATSSYFFGLSYNFFTWYIPILIMKCYGASSLSMSYIMGGIVSTLVIFSGITSDILGYKVPIILVPCALLASYILLISHTTLWSITIVLISINLVPLASPAIFAIISNLIEPKMLGSAFSLYRLVMLAGFSTSSVFLSIIAQLFGYKTALFIAILSLLATIILRSLIKINAKEPEKLGSRKNKGFISLIKYLTYIFRFKIHTSAIIVLIALLQALSLSYSPYFYNFVRFVMKLNIAFLGMYRAMSLIVSAVSQVIAGSLVDRYGVNKCFCISLLVNSLVTCSVTVLVFIHVNPFLIIGLLLLLSLLGAINSISISVIIARISDKRYRATVYGLTTTLASLTALPLYPMFSLIWQINPSIIPASYGVSMLFILFILVLFKIFTYIPK